MWERLATLARGAYRFIDRTNDSVGRVVSVLCLVMVVVQFIVVLQRYAFGVGSVKMQESVVYMHAAVFMIGGAFALRRNCHVRVDIFYRTASQRARDLTDLFGTLFLLLPWCVVVILHAWFPVAQSWRFGEGSLETSGIQFRYILRSLLLVLPALLFLQGLSTILKTLLRLSGRSIDDVFADPR